MNDDDRLALHEAAVDLERRARSARAELDVGSDERTFLLGVDAAALEVLHPELTTAHTDAWIGRQEPAFREGFLRSRAAFAAAAETRPAPSRVRMPDYASART